MHPAVEYKNGIAHCEGMSLPALAERHGTPLYVYSSKALEENVREALDAFRDFPTLVCFAVKANGNLAILRKIFGLGAGADVVSQGEMERALRAGAKPERLVFSGVGKQHAEIRRAVELGIHSLNVESEFEIEHVAKAARDLGKPARISLRVNPDVDAKTHPAIATGLHEAKFGIAEDDARRILKKLSGHASLRVVGLAAHVGSQIVELDPFRETAERLAGLAGDAGAMGHALEHIDLGGGLGIRYEADEKPPTWSDYARTVLPVIRPTGLKLVLEPGRRLVATAGALVTRVIGVKRTSRRAFVVVDAAMNDLMRPALYDAYHAIHTVSGGGSPIVADVVGPVCETGDILGRARELPEPREGDLLWIENAGAYGMAMSSQYNDRPRAAEVLVQGIDARLVRRRETFDDLFCTELE